MSNNLPMYLMFGSAGLLVLIVIGYFILNKALNKDDVKYARQLVEGTQSKTFSMEVLYQKLYMVYIKIPGIKRY